MFNGLEDLLTVGFRKDAISQIAQLSNRYTGFVQNLVGEGLAMGDADSGLGRCRSDVISGQSDQPFGIVIESSYEMDVEPAGQIEVHLIKVGRHGYRAFVPGSEFFVSPIHGVFIEIIAQVISLCFARSVSVSVATNHLETVETDIVGAVIDLQRISVLTADGEPGELAYVKVSVAADMFLRVVVCPA